jgi:transcriptional regulator with XRE-family HTH domain
VIAHPNEAHSDPNVQNIGTRVRDLRVARAMTIRDLSKLSGVSQGLISQIERNAANPSVKTLMKIRLALGVPLTSLFDGDRESDIARDPSYVLRLEQRPMFEYAEQFTKEMLSPASESGLEFMILNIPPGSGWDKTPLSYAAEKAGMVLEGTLVLCVDDEETALKAGDSFQFNGMRPHSVQNRSTTLCRTLWIINQNLTRPPI